MDEVAGAARTQIYMSLRLTGATSSGTVGQHRRPFALQQSGYYLHGVPQAAWQD